MHLGLALPHYDFSFPDGRALTVDATVDYARRAEAIGFDSVWVSDHLFLDLRRYGGPPGRRRSIEAMSLLGAVAAATDRVRLGPLVLCAPFRNPVVLAEQARALHEAAGGRLELGLGAGWHGAEFVEAGIPFGTAGARITSLREYAGVVGARLGGSPRVFVGGKGGPRIMRIVAEAADGWNVVWQMTPGVYRDRLATLEEACRAAGRAISDLRLSVGLSTLLAPREADLPDRFARLQRWAPGGALDATSLEEWTAGRLVGTVESAAETVAEFEALGVDELILSPASLPFAIFDDEQLELAAALIRHLR